MTRSGFSDPVALLQAARLSRRSAAGFVAAMILCNVGRATGHDTAAAQAFALVFAYAFIGMTLIISGRLRILLGTTTTTGRVLLVTGMIVAGGFLLLASALSLVSLTWLMFTLGTGSR